MNQRECKILETVIGDAEPRLKLRSNTRVDAGRWWWPTNLWICITEEEVILFAVARRHYLQRVPVAACHASHYCHTTGELVIEAGADLRYRHLAMSPSDGLQVLNAIHAGVKSNPAAPPAVCR